MTYPINTNELQKLLRHDPETGRLWWKPRPADMFSSERAAKIWNTRYTDKEAFTYINRKLGYKMGNILGKSYLAHRVIWALEHGVWPTSIDHIDRDRTNNALFNLREVNQQTNLRNASMKSNNTSGYTGVSWDKAKKKWRAYINAPRNIHIGYFDNIESAVEARQEATRSHGFHHNHGK